MSFQIIEIDISNFLEGIPLPSFQFLESEDGVAVIFRDGDAIVGFEMQDRKSLPNDPDQILANLVSDATLNALVAQRLRKSLRPRLDQAPSLTVAICSKDRPHWVSRLLASLVPLCRDDCMVEILVVDNAPSDDRTREVVDSFGAARYVRENLPGLDFARNRALAEARGEIIAYLDDDVVVDRHWLKGLQTAWAESPDAGAVTGLVLPMFLETEAQVLFERRGGFRRGFLPQRFGSTLHGDALFPCGAGRFGAGANMSFRTELVRKLGGFDEALDTGRPLPGGGDLDMFYRVLRAGGRLIYEPQMAVRHEHRRELETLHRQYYTWGLGMMAYVVKSKRSDLPMKAAFNKLVIWWIGYQLKRCLLALTGKEVTPLRMILSEIKGGFVGYFGEYDRSVRRSALIKAGMQG